MKMERKEAESIMKSWCSTERKALQEPFALDGWLYATDGRRVIRTNTDDLDDNTIVSGYIRNLYFEIENQQPWPNPGIELECVTCCCKCDGAGHEAIVCAQCDGTGERECFHCGSIYACDRCTKGWIIGKDKCQTCTDGEAQSAADVMIDGKILSGTYTQAVNAIPGDKVYSTQHNGQFTIHTTDGRFEMIVMCKREV